MNIKKYLQDHLNKQQCQAAKCTEQNSLILAGAGSGKTRTLTYKIAYLIFEKNVNPHDILAVTFTNKAANEMKERIKQIADDINLNSNNSPKDQELPDFDSLVSESNENTSSNKTKQLNEYSFFWTGTFHSIFLKILKKDIEKLDMGYNTNFGVYDQNDSKKLIKEIIKENNLKDEIKAKKCKRKISELKNDGIQPEQFLHTLGSQKEEHIGKVYQLYQKKLRKQNALDFDDLLMLPYLLFKQNKKILNKWQNFFKYILVDEAQDTNHIQFELIKMLSTDNNKITLIGDDFQSIYGWRGAVMENFLNVSKRWPNIQQFKLEINYRSRPHIVQAGNHIIAKNTNQYEKKISAHRADNNQKIKIFEYQRDTDEAENVVSMIEKIKTKNELKRKDFAILYRTNAQSQPFEETLINEAIPYKVWGGFKFFERKEIKDIIAYLKYILNPRETVSLLRIINTPNRQIGSKTIEKIQNYSDRQNQPLHETINNIENTKLSSSIKSKIKNFKTIMQYTSNIIDNSTPKKILENIIKTIEYEDYIIDKEGKEKAKERMENIGQLINMASNYDDTGKETLRDFIEELSLMSDLEEDNKGEMNVVNLMTVHSSKGLEFPYVFVVGLEDNVFPMSSAMLDSQELQEERRLMYVALTRAEDQALLTYAQSRKKRGQIKYNPPSRFIGEIPDKLSKHYDLSAKSSYKDINTQDLNEGDQVKHKLFGQGTIKESWGNVVVVKFQKNKFGLRKVKSKYLEKL